MWIIKVFPRKIDYLGLLKNIPLQLVLSIIFSMLIADKLSLNTVRFFYTISFCFIEILLFVLPVIVFSFILRALLGLKNGSILLLLLIFIGVTFSNCIALTTSYFFSKTFLPFIGLQFSPNFAAKLSSDVTTLFTFGLPNIIRTEQALLAGIASGISLNLFKEGNLFKAMLKNKSIWLSDKISLVLTNIFIPLLPFYVFGFCLKLSHDKALAHLFQQYGKVFLLSLFLLAVYLFCMYLIASKGNFRKAFYYIKIMLPAGLAGFCTMSSAATMPVTLRCAEAATKNKNFTDLVIPSTANIHMLGDDLTIIVMAMTLMSVFGISWPDFITFLPFAFAFSVAKLSCVGIPGASVFVVLPILQTYLNFSPEMLSILTTIYVLQDPFGTASNVMGNGSFTLILDRIYNKS
ncbi:MAG: cation:dicarboxylase symporter family transporter [Candidatus Paracaedibacteraceae bacterium]|nr:cation:dicarboxylase symporter family transporter [Candidatus Paracaedibacteraceae bacterium]